MKSFLLALLACLPAAAAAQSRDLEFFDFERASLQDIIDIRTQVASRLDFAGREAPGILTVITREEIADSGARDLPDLLRFVPGLDLGVDVEGNLGIGVRGNWAHEGKALLLVDGQSYNEPLFGTPQIERIAVDQVERIEIIRGPGSAVYGGTAGLCVIKITTLGAKAIGGSQASATAGATARGGRRYGLNLAYGSDSGPATVSAQAFTGWQDHGDRRFRDFSGGSYSMKGDSDLDSKNLNLALARGGYKLRLIADQYRTQQRDGYTTALLPHAYDRNFDAYFAELSREYRPGEELTVTPSASWSLKEPYSGTELPWYFRDKQINTVKAAVNAVYAAGPALRISAGAETSGDMAKFDWRVIHSTTTYYNYQFEPGTERQNIWNSAVYMEGVAEVGAGTFSAGARYDRNSRFSPAFSPRLAWTKAVDRFHFKAIYSGAFRAPGIDNLNVNPDLKPERTYTRELEAGYKAGEDAYVSLNVFQIDIKDPIVFYTDSASNQRYGNYGRTGTNGHELTLRVKKGWGHANLSYSHYDANKNRVAIYQAGAGSLPAFARDKVAASASFKLAQGLTANPSAVCYSGRRGFSAPGVTRRFDDALLANLFLRRTGLAKGRLELGLGIYNLFNTPFGYLQPYDGGHAELPARSRELAARAAYKF